MKPLLTFPYPWPIPLNSKWEFSPIQTFFFDSKAIKWCILKYVQMYMLIPPFPNCDLHWKGWLKGHTICILSSCNNEEQHIMATPSFARHSRRYWMKNYIKNYLLATILWLRCVSLKQHKSYQFDRILITLIVFPYFLQRSTHCL